MHGYYHARDARRAIEAFAVEPVDAAWNAQTVLTVPVFLALVMDRHPDMAATLVATVRDGDPVKIEIAAQALNYCHHPRRQTLMDALVGESAAARMDAQGADFKAFQASHPVHVDMLWAAFLATGDADYVIAVAHLLGGWLPEPQLQPLLAKAAGDEGVARIAMAAVLAKAAMALLGAELRAIPEIRDILIRYAATNDGLGSALASRLLAAG